MVDHLANALNTIKNNEIKGNAECVIRPSTKIIKNVLKVLKENGYIEDFIEVQTEIANLKEIKVKLCGKINECKAIKPRASITYKELQKYEERYIPSRDVGLLIISTPKGLVTNKQARELKTGGVLIAYVY
ncbi:MAG: 30S ribosomal protein S8 [Candidatus Micrarchaeia archaeon]|jgi:small subunit ribosomal protein S8